MATIAIYSMKGGVGKTTIAVNLAWASAAISKRSTLLWDIDGQAASTFVLLPKRPAREEAAAVLRGDVDVEDLILPTGIDGLDIIPADPSLYGLDETFAEIGRKKRLLRLTQSLAARYDRIILDCPPGLGGTSDQLIRGASLILLPMIPSSLSRRAFVEVRDHLDRRHKGGPPVFPVFNMVDRRRQTHLKTMAADPGCPVIPMASAIEQMPDRHAPVGVYAPGSPAAKAFAGLWTAVERQIVRRG